MPDNPQQQKVDLFVAGCLAQMEAGRDWFAERVLPLSLDQLRWRAGIGGWSILECLSHLHHTFEHYVPGLEQAIHQNPRQPGHFGSGLLFPESEGEFLKQAEPPIGTAFLMPPFVVRVPATSPDQIVDQRPQLRGRYAGAVRTAVELDLANVIVAGSMHPLIRSLGGVVALLAAYDRLHIRQAEQVRRAPGFPADMAGIPRKR